MALHLLDTNILLRSVDQTSREHVTTRDTLMRLLAENHTLCVTPQNLIEFWSVATRPVEVNGLDWPSDRVQAEVERLLNDFDLLDDTPEVLSQWMELVRTLHVRGRRVHDARLVAIMYVHGVTHLVTLSPSDFKSFPGITVVIPG